MLRDLRAAADAAGEKVRAGIGGGAGRGRGELRAAVGAGRGEPGGGRAGDGTGDPGAGAAGAAVAEGLGRARQEVSEFVSERIRQDIATQAELLGCRSLGEVSAVQARFFRTADGPVRAEGAARWRGSAPR